MAAYYVYAVKYPGQPAVWVTRLAEKDMPMAPTERVVPPGPMTIEADSPDEAIADYKGRLMVDGVLDIKKLIRQGGLKSAEEERVNRALAQILGKQEADKDRKRGIRSKWVAQDKMARLETAGYVPTGEIKEIGGVPHVRMATPSLEAGNL
jgi:hypothetical protein